VANDRVIGCGRCPLKKTHYPQAACPEALKAMEAIRKGQPAQGCPFFINDLSAGCCFFRYMAENNGTAIPDHRIATLLLMPDDDVKKIVANFKRRAATTRALLDD
jgi:hypothetical protein